MEHTNKIAIELLREEYADYPENDWHYDRIYEMLVKAQSKLQVPSEDAIDCIKQIADPLSNLKDEAEKNGFILDGEAAIRLCNDANYLKEIANNWLKSHLEQQEEKSTNK